MYSAEYVEDMRCGYCRGKDELFQRDADFWGGALAKTGVTGSWKDNEM